MYNYPYMLHGRWSVQTRNIARELNRESDTPSLSVGTLASSILGYSFNELQEKHFLHGRQKSRCAPSITKVPVQQCAACSFFNKTIKVYIFISHCTS